MEATETDERGAQLSQECPPPVSLPSGTKVRTAQFVGAAACFEWAESGYIVAAPAKSFHGSRPPLGGRPAEPDRKRAIRYCRRFKKEETAPSPGG